MRRLWLIFILMLMTIQGGLAQETPVIDADLAAQIELLEADTSAIRGLTELAPIAIAFPTREDVLIFLEGIFEAYYTPETITQETAFYHALELIPATYDLVPELQSLLGEQVAGYYDTDTQIMNVILSSGGQAETYLPFLDRVIYAHEYVHALQDQHFDLDEFYADVEAGDNVDAILARQALVEGDATAVMNTYTQIEAEADPLGVLLEVGAGLIQIGNVSIPAGTPRIINQELTFPYLMGEQFVRALLAVDGWETVNAAYTDNPPLSTEHILHPERYLANDHPVAVTLTDDSILLGADWALVRQGVLGEFYLREWLLTAPEIDSDLVDVGATGWGGDAYHIYQDERGNYAYEMHLVWDTPDDAATFYYETLLAFGNQKTNTPAPDHYADSEAFCWVTDNQALCVAFTEGITRVVLAPDEGLAQGLIGN